MIKLPTTNYKLSTISGFTLVELLLYVGISSAILLASSLFLATLLESRIKNQTIAEVEQQGLAVMQMVTQDIRNAEVINSPIRGTNGIALSLNLVEGVNNPIIFDSADGAIQIKEGLNSAIPLTNTRVAVSNLFFSNLARASTTDTIRVQFTLSAINKTGRNEYSFSRNFINSATLR